MDNPMWMFYLISIFSFILVVLVGVQFGIIRKLRKGIRLHKRIIESKSKAMVSGTKRKIFDRGLILSFDTSGAILSINDAVSEFLGFGNDDVVGKNVIGTLIPAKDSIGNNMSKIVEHFVANPKLYIDIETEVLTKRGDKRWVSWTNRAVNDAEGNLQSFTCVGFDVTPRKLLEKELEDLSCADVIKGVYNKATFLDIGNKELMRAIRYNRDLSLVAFAVHRNNKTAVTSTEDIFLQASVDVCKDLIRDCDYIGRIGDNEFALLLPETKISNAQTLVKRIKVKVIELLQEEETLFSIDSIGAAGREDGDETVDDLVIRALDSLENIEN